MCINAPEDTQGADDSDSNTTPDNFINAAESISQVLEEYLSALYPDSKLYESAEISLSFVSPEEIRELNKEYRDTDEATDVLSFPLLGEEPVEVPELPVLALGDIVICPEQTAKLHPELEPVDALCLMTAHSFLHLLGWDHDTQEAQNSMWALQDEIAAKIRGRL